VRFLPDKKIIAWLSSCRYCADRAQNLAGASPRQCTFAPDFAGVIAECVNTAKTRRKVNPTLG